MPRNAEVIRQWSILREIERSRAAGVTIDELASQCSVTTRTIRRDLQALEEAGFPIYDDRSRDDGRTRWIINGQAFKGLAAGLTLSELCALYFSRALERTDYALAKYGAQGRKAEAGVDIARALGIYPGYPEALVERGTMRLEAGDKSGARNDWQLAAKEAPDSATAATALAHLKLLGTTTPPAKR